MVGVHGVSELLGRLVGGEVLVSDGATGTYLQARGLEAGACPEEFNANHPEIVRQMVADYFAAGSDMVETNSFGGTRYMLAKHGLADRVEELNRLAAEHARSAAPPGRFVLGSMGPTGEFLEPMGISQYRLAKDISVPARRINEIVHGKRSVTADTALRLSRYFGTSERFWLNLQTGYDLDIERDRLGDRLEAEVLQRAG